MLEAVLVFGAVIFVGVAAVFIKLPLKWSLWLLGHHVATDVGVTVLVLVLHWGTITGLMSATVAGLICSVTTSVGRCLYGYRLGNFYYPGHYDLSGRLLKEIQK